MKIRDLLTREFTIADSGESAQLYRQQVADGHPVVVQENGELVGILTMKDMVLRPDSTAGNAVNPRVVVHEDQEPFQVLIHMCHHNDEFLPVVDGPGRFTGVIAKKSLFSAFINGTEDQPSIHARFSLAERKLGAKDKMLAVLAHDMKNLFNQVLGTIELLSAKPGNAPQRNTSRLTPVLKASAINVANTFDELLLWARLDSGMLQLKKVTVVLPEFLQTLRDDFALECRVRRISIQLAIDPGVTLEADRAMLGSMLRNILHNAIKFSPTESIIVIAVKADRNGIEIDIDNDTTEPLDAVNGNSSTGFGLSICREFAFLHGAVLEITQPCKGHVRAALLFPGVSRAEGSASNATKHQIPG